MPLNSDLFFIGRASFIQDHIDAIRRSENRGVFGLRKTGKTSVLFKIDRMCEASGIAAKYYDCKLPLLYRMSADELLDKIASDIEERFDVKIKGWRSKKSAVDRFFTLIEKLPEDRRFCLIFDEIEYISPGSRLAPHWSDDFVPFWQTLWSAQSQFRKFNFLVAGVNPTVVESDRVAGVQNPIFGIVKSSYLTVFEKGELYSLLSVLGKRMGLGFDDAAVTFLHDRYGGHPLITRMICSQVNSEIRSSGKERPVSISVCDLEKDLEDLEEEISFYCDHIFSELKEFYPLEYDMLELLAVGNIADFHELARDGSLVKHLKAYGLLDTSDPTAPKLRIPVLRKFIASKWQQENKQDWPRYVVPRQRRVDYVKSRVEAVVRDLRLAERRFTLAGAPSLFNGAGPAESEQLTKSTPVGNGSDLASFLNQLNRSLVEPIDREGRRQSINQYFFSEIKAAFPRLQDALNRVRAYRNKFLHLDLNPIATAEYNRYLGSDLNGKDAASVPDGFFRIQSAVLDGLVVGIQAELDRYE